MILHVGGQQAERLAAPRSHVLLYAYMPALFWRRIKAEALFGIAAPQFCPEIWAAIKKPFKSRELDRTLLANEIAARATCSSAMCKGMTHAKQTSAARRGPAGGVARTLEGNRGVERGARVPCGGACASGRQGTICACSAPPPPRAPHSDPVAGRIYRRGRGTPCHEQDGSTGTA